MFNIHFDKKKINSKSIILKSTLLNPFNVLLETILIKGELCHNFISIEVHYIDTLLAAIILAPLSALLRTFFSIKMDGVPFSFDCVFL
jgi:hypothetical protein